MLETKVSIIITTYKGSNCIDRAIKSLLNQTYKNIEIIVVDDNEPTSEDRIKTEEKMKKYLDNKIFKYIKHEKNLNGAVARNTGIKIATGEFICFLDDDDYYLSQRIEKSVTALVNNNKVEAIFTGVIITDNKYIQKIIIPDFKGDLCKELIFNVNMVGTGSNLFLRKSAVISINGFDETFTRLQDIEFLLRFFEKYNVCCIREPLIIKMQSETNNLPKYEKLKDIKSIFYNKFYRLITSLSEDERKRYFTNEKARLLQSCYGNEKYVNIKKAIIELKEYRPLTIKERVFIILSQIGIPPYNAYYIIRKISAKIMKPIVDKRNRKKYNLMDDIYQLMNVE